MWNSLSTHSHNTHSTNWDITYSSYLEFLPRLQFVDTFFYIYLSRGAELPENLLLPSTEVGSEPGEKLKKKSKQRARDVKASKSDSNHENVVREDGAQQNKAKAEDIVHGLPMTFEQNPNPANDKLVFF